MSSSQRLQFSLATSEEIARELGLRLRAQRVAKSITQEELASRAGISLGAVKNLESTGQTTLQTFVRVIQALSLSDELADILKLRQELSIANMELAEKAKRARARRPRQT